MKLKNMKCEICRKVGKNRRTRHNGVERQRDGESRGRRREAGRNCPLRAGSSSRNYHVKKHAPKDVFREARHERIDSERILKNKNLSKYRSTHFRYGTGDDITYLGVNHITVLGTLSRHSPVVHIHSYAIAGSDLDKCSPTDQHIC